VACSLWDKDALHRAGISLGERLLRDVQQPLFRRTAKEGGVRHSLRSEGPGEEYSNHYNQERRHGSLGYRPLAEYAASCELVNADKDITKVLESAIALS
jgi:hypothetical protein